MGSSNYSHFFVNAIDPVKHDFKQKFADRVIVLSISSKDVGLILESVDPVPSLV